MSEELPEGWVWTTLGKLALSVRNGIFVSRAGTEPSGTPILRIGSVRSLRLDLEDVRYTGMPATEEVVKSALLTPGNLLFTRYNGNPEFVGCCAVVPAGIGDLTYPDKLIRVVIDEQLALPSYVAFACAAGTTRDVIRNSVKTTAGQAGISGRELRAVPIPLPPLAEQHRIVEALEDHVSHLNAASQYLDSGMAKIRSAELSLLDSAVRGRLIPRSGGSSADLVADISSRRAARKPPMAAASVPGYDVPDGWSVASLDALSDSSGYGTSTKCDYGATGAPVLRIPNVRNGEIDLGDLKNAIDNTLDLTDLYVASGDILFVRTNGSKDLIGRAAIAREFLEVAFASYLIRFRLVPNGINPLWVRTVVSSPLWRSLIESQAASSAGQHNVNQKILGSLPIPVPSLEEQEAIIAELAEQTDRLGRLGVANARARLRASTLRRSLLTEAFTGRLVPQDPADEPASELLKRVEAGRDAQPKPSRVRKTAAVKTIIAPPKHTSAVPAGIQEELAL